MECKCIDCPNKCHEYYNNGVSDRAYYEWSIKERVNVHKKK